METEKNGLFKWFIAGLGGERNKCRRKNADKPLSYGAKIPSE